MLKDYTFNDHRHNFSIWTAARAVQRNFAKTELIKKAINQSGLREFVEFLDTEVSIEDFNSLHKEWARQLVKVFESDEIESCTYGRAAKIIAIYLKTSIILCNKGNGNLSEIVHPPIDRVLLQNLSKVNGFRFLKDINWTQLTEDQYWALVEKLTIYFKSFNWRLEKYWHP